MHQTSVASVSLCLCSGLLVTITLSASDALGNQNSMSHNGGSVHIWANDAWGHTPLWRSTLVANRCSVSRHVFFSSDGPKASTGGWKRANIQNRNCNTMYKFSRWIVLVTTQWLCPMSYAVSAPLVDHIVEHFVLLKMWGIKHPLHPLHNASRLTSKLQAVQYFRYWCSSPMKMFFSVLVYAVCNITLGK